MIYLQLVNNNNNLFKIIIFFLWVSFNFCSLLAVDFYKGHYNTQNFSLTKYYSEFGVHGYFLQNISKVIFKKDEREIKQPRKQIALI